MKFEEAKDFPMPDGVQEMTKQSLWNWMYRTQRAHTHIDQMRRWFHTQIAGENFDHRYTQAEIIDLQAKRIRGLKLQMQQMNRGYRKKIAKLQAQLEISPKCDSGDSDG